MGLAAPLGEVGFDGAKPASHLRYAAVVVPNFNGGEKRLVSAALMETCIDQNQTKLPDVANGRSRRLFTCCDARWSMHNQVSHLILLSFVTFVQIRIAIGNRAV